MGSKKYNYTAVRGKFVYILAFIIPMVILIAIYFAREIYPFGDSTYLRSDMYHQYLPFYSELWNKIRGLDGFTYSWNIGLGINFTALYAYYLSSPVNWIIFLFPHEHLIEVMNVFIILKISAASLTFTYYICKRFNTEKIYVSLFGMFYALSGYLAAYSWNIMWLDCIVLLPLIFLGLERLVREKKCFLYALTLGLAILSNYYISIMICITAVIYFIFLVIRYAKSDLRWYTVTILNFAVFSLLAGGLAAVLLIPEMCALRYTVSSNITFPKTLTEYFPILQMLSRHLMNVPIHMGLEHHPNIYCGVAVFLLLPLYVMNKKINTREKAGKLVLLLIFLVAFNMNIFNFIWHGFHFPNSLPCRQSFIYIFILLTMCYDAFKDLKFYSRSELTASFWIAIGFLLFADQFLTNGVVDFKIIYISGLFIGLYMLLIYLYRNRRIPYMFFLFLLYTGTILECALNFEETALGTTDRTYYLEDNKDIAVLLDTANDLSNGAFYRIEKYSGVRTKNDAAWHNYPSVSTFSSTANGGLTKLYRNLGMESSTNAYSYNGATYLSSALLGVKYVISDKQMIENTLLTFIAQSGGSYLYQNNYVLPLGFMVPSTFPMEWDKQNTNPFSVQNSFLRTACGVENVFVPLSCESITSSSVAINPARTQQIYFRVLNTNLDTVNVYINENSTSYNIKHNHLIDLGILNASDEIRVTSNDTDTTLSVHAYTINQTAFIDAMNRLNQNGLQITKFNKTEINGVITAETDGYMLMSIPYDCSWKIYVDGSLIKQESIEDALTLVALSAGTHNIRMKYTPEGLHLGMTISIICAIILVMLFVLSRKKKMSADSGSAEKLPLADNSLPNKEEKS